MSLVALGVFVWPGNVLAMDGCCFVRTGNGLQLLISLLELELEVGPVLLVEFVINLIRQLRKLVGKSLQH